MGYAYILMLQLVVVQPDAWQPVCHVHACALCQLLGTVVIAAHMVANAATRSLYIQAAVVYSRIVVRSWAL
jgi:hypothetical protein